MDSYTKAVVLLAIAAGLAFAALRSFPVFGPTPLAVDAQSASTPTLGG